MEENIETSHSKGFEFEKKFSKFLKTDLSWDKTVIRPQMASAINMRGTNVDIVASRSDRRGEKLQKVAKMYFAISLGVLGLCLIFPESSWYETGIIFSIISAIGSIITVVLSDIYNVQNAWVECKNRKSKSDIRQIQQVISDYEAYKLSGHKKYKFVSIYFVSAAGFTETALSLAEANGIKCYSLSDGKFVQQTYWEH